MHAWAGPLFGRRRKELVSEGSNVVLLTSNDRYTDQVFISSPQTATLADGISTFVATILS